MALLLAAGCSAPRSADRPATQPVTGTVTLNGNPVDGATVTFQPIDASGKAAVGLTDSAGKYALTTFGSNDGAVSGSYKITVIKTETPAPSNGDAAGEYVPPEALGPGARPAAPKNLLPEKYANAQTSGLTATVKEESNTINLTLEAGGEAAPQ